MKEMDTWSILGKLLTLVLVLVSYHFAARSSGHVFDVLIFLLCSLGLVFRQMNISVPDKASSSSSSLPSSSSSSSASSTSSSSSSSSSASSTSLPSSSSSASSPSCSSSSSSSASSTSLPSSSSSSSSSASPSSSSSKGSLYEVFISFRGEDTRKNFTGHLHETLTRAGINAFIDDEELRRGEDITTELVRAIQGSRISIIVFSRRYADSSWCLEELVKIMECRRTLGQLVLPIFYDVDPSHVRKQTGSFAQSFLKHTDEKKVEMWRTALTEASNLSGWDLRNTLDGHEAKFIRMITEEVTRKLNNTYLDVAPYQVGIDSRVQAISNYLCIGDSDDVRVIGILGMGGIGKTTLARAIYNEFYERFDGKSLLEKVREKKLEKLQKQLLFDILQTKTKVSSVAAGTALVGERFRRLKVLVIVDDVDDVRQLRELAGTCHSFGPGSRIIITTRNERVLKEFAVDKIYQVKGMNQEEALELLSWHAFRSSCCPSQYLALVREVVNYCGGLPLALEVLGSTLFKRSVDEWRNILDELKMIPRGEIQAQLKISYDGLNDDYKRRIFLDIACFFIGMDKNDVMQILDGCGFYATTGIEVLLDLCLVTIGRKNKIMMHDLLRDMGRDIVHAENPNFPRERSRLWRPEDVNDVLIDKSGTEKIEGLALNLSSLEETSFSTEAFRNMKRLRLLQLNYVRLAGGYQCLSKNLRWLCWHGFPLEFIPIELCQPNIVAIDMRYSSLKQVLCEYSGLLGKLKILNLSHSHDLTQSPDFLKFPNLEKLILKDCKRLAEVHKSIGDLKSLVLVNLEGCETLMALPRSFYKLKSVKTLVLNGCSRFRSLSEHLGKMASLVTLYADGTAIKKVPPSIVRLGKLERLSLSYLKCLLPLPSLRGLRSLTSLSLAGNNLEEVPNDIGSSLPCLCSLYLGDNNFRSLPSLSGLSKLHTIFLNGCRNLVEITDLPKRLEHLGMDDCSALERMPDFSGMSTYVNIGSPKLIEFPGVESVLNSGHGIDMPIHNKVTDYLLKDSTLQGWTGGGGWMDLVGRQIPTWFNHVNEGTQVSFEMPKEIGCNAKALAVCVACVPHDDAISFDDMWKSYVYVINHTKRTSFCVEIGELGSIEDVLWLGNLSWSETEFNLEEGDSVLVHAIAHCPNTVVKKIGVRLRCDKLKTREGTFVYRYIPYERALEEICTEDDDFDEDIDEDDDDDDEDDVEEDQDDDEDDDEEDQDGDANDEDDDNHDDDDDGDYGFGVMSQVKDSDDEPVAHSLETDKPETGSIESIGGGGEDEEEEPVDEPDDPMEDDAVNPAAVFCIRLKQPRSNLQHKMSVPELCRNFSAVAWCGKLNAIACASETCASIPSSNANVPFGIPIHIVIPERPTERAVFNVNADSPRDSVQFIEWSPTCCPGALLIANFHGRVTIWTRPSQGPANLVHNTSRWQREHEWQQDIAVVTKWLSGVSPYKLLSSKSSTSSNGKSTFEEKSLSQQSQNSARWPSFLCVCSVFSSGSVQLHWSQYPPNPTSAAPKWFQTSKGLLGAGTSGIMAADAIITDSGAMHVAGVPIVNPSTVVVWEVAPGLGNGFHATPKISTTDGVPPSMNPPNWAGFSPLAAYLFSWQDYLLSEAKQGGKQTDPDFSDTVPLHCSPVSNFSAYVSPEAASQSATTTTRGSGVTAVAFDPTHGGSVIAVVVVEGQYMSPYDPDEVTGWRVQRWESSRQPLVHQIFGNPTSSFGGQAPMQTVWLSKVDTSIQPTNDFKSHQAAATTATTDARKTPDSGIEKVKRVSFDPFDLPSDVRTLARIVYSAHGGEIAVAFLRGGVHIFSGPNFAPVDNYQINVGSAIATPAFSSTSCCSASVWHDSGKDRTVLKIIRVLPPAVPSSQVKANSSTWERAIAERFWRSLFIGVDWWDVVGCTRSAAEDGIVSLNSVIAVLDANFHSLPSAQHRQRFGPCLDRLKCRLLEGTNAQEVRAMVLDKQARLLNPSALVPEPWQASGEMLSGIDPEAMAIEPALVPHIQAYVDAVLDLASHFITRLRRYASFCRTLASHAVTAGAGSNRNMVAGPTQSSASPATSQGGQSGTTNSTGNTQMQAWVQGAIAKISSTSDGVSNSTPNPISGPSSFMPISINTGTFPGTPAVRLIGDCHFLHRLCQLLLFCFFFRRTQLPRFSGGAQRNADSNMQKPQPGAPGKVEEVSSVSAKSSTTMVRPEEGQIARPSQIPGAKGVEEGPAGRSRLGAGNAGQGYTFEEVKVLFLILMDLCRRTASLAHPLPVSQVGSSNIQVRLHYIDGNYTVLPEVVEASLGPHMQNMPRPRGADAAGLLLRELELHPPAEEWHRRNMYGGPWSDPDDMGPQDDTPKLCNSSDLPDSGSLESCDVYYGAHGLWPRKRRMSERDAAFGLNTSVGLGAYLGIMGSRRDVVTAVWKTGLEGVWYKCIRCLRQTSAFASPDAATAANQTGRETWWISRWAYCCPMCGGTWVRVV